MIIRHDTVDPIEFDGLEIVDYTAVQEHSSSLAEISEVITLVRSGGDCNGYWGHRHYVIETAHRRYSISIGGSE